MKKIILVCVLFLSACFGEKTEEFKLGEYMLTESQNNVPTKIAFFEEGRFAGKVVNNIMGRYELGKNNTIRLDEVGTTMMMGPKEAMEAEQNFLQILPKIKSYKMQGTFLVLVTDSGAELVFKPMEKQENESESKPQENRE